MINNLLEVGYSSNSTTPFVTRGRISPFVETRTARLSLNLTSSIHRDCDFYHPNCSKISNEFWGLVLAIWFPIDRLAFLYCNEAWVTRHHITQPIRCLQLSWFQVQFEATGFWYPKSLFVSLLLGPWTQLIINWVMLWTVGYDTFTPNFGKQISLEYSSKHVWFNRSHKLLCVELHESFASKRQNMCICVRVGRG